MSISSSSGKTPFIKVFLDASFLSSSLEEVSHKKKSFFRRQLQ